MDKYNRMDDSGSKRKLVAVVGISCLLFLALGIAAILLYSSTVDTQVHIRLPKAAHIDQRTLTLPNGLEVVLYSDKEAEVAAAAMAVGSGSLSEEIEGLAHFVEHLLFISSEKYPEEGLFMGMVAENGGMTNAFTATEKTVFFFSVKPEAFNKTLDVFSGFFTCPNFPPSRVQDEIKAVNSEYEMYLLDDHWRGYRMLQVLSNPAHPLSKFTVGSFETLGNITRLDEVARNFTEAHYVGSNMKLVLYGKQSLAEMESWVRTMFTAVPEGTAPQRDLTIPVFNTTNKILLAPSVSEGHTLSLVWQMPPLSAYYKQQPADFIAYLLTGKGSEGLKNRLMSEGFIADMSAEASDDLDDALMFEMSLELTDYGFAHWNDCVTLIDSYLRALSSGSESQFSAAYNHFVTKNLVTFDYQYDPTAVEFTLKTSINMLEFPVPDYFGGKSLQNEFSHDDILKHLSLMTREKAVVIFTSSEWEGAQFQGKEVVFSNEEHYYQIPYEVVELPPAEKPIDVQGAFWPQEPIVSADQLSLENCTDCSTDPLLLHDSPVVSLWYSVTPTQFDARYSRPIAQLSLLLPVAPSLSSEGLGRMFQAQVELLLQQKLAQFDIGLNFRCEWTTA